MRMGQPFWSTIFKDGDHTCNRDLQGLVFNYLQGFEPDQGFNRVDLVSSATIVVFRFPKQLPRANVATVLGICILHFILVDFVPSAAAWAAIVCTQV